MALNFNGTTNKIVNDSVAVVSGPGPATFAAWVRPDVNGTEKRILGCYGTTSAQLYGIEMSSVGKAQCQIRNNASNFSNATGTTTLSTTAFQHIAGRFDANGKPEVFYNGASEGIGVNTSGAITLSKTQIGVVDRSPGSTATQFWDGDIAECAIWNEYLDAEEIAALAKGFSPALIRPSALVFYAPLIRDVVDLKGLALTPTGTAVSDHSRTISRRKRSLIGRTASPDAVPAAIAARGGMIVNMGGMMAR